MSDLIERVARVTAAKGADDPPGGLPEHWVENERPVAEAAIREVLAAQQDFLDRQPRDLKEDFQVLICATMLLLMFAREHGIKPAECGTTW